jgi:chromosome segregation ATPase
LTKEGVAVFAVKNGDVDPSAGLRYEDLLEHLGAVFREVRVLGEVPFSGTTLADFEPASDDFDAALDCSLVAEDELPSGYLALCSDQPLAAQPYTVVQLPGAGLSAEQGATELHRLAEELRATQIRASRAEAQLEQTTARAERWRLEAERLGQSLDSLRRRAGAAGERGAHEGGDPKLIDALTRRLEQAEQEGQTLALALERQKQIAARLQQQLAAGGGQLAAEKTARRKGSPQPVDRRQADQDSSNELRLVLEGSRRRIDELESKLDQERQRLEEARGQLLQRWQLLAEAQAKLETERVRTSAAETALVAQREQVEAQRVRAEGAERRCDALLNRIEQGAAELTALHQRWAELQALRQADQWRIDELTGRLRFRQVESQETLSAELVGPAPTSVPRAAADDSRAAAELGKHEERARQAESRQVEAEARLQQAQREIENLERELNSARVQGASAGERAPNSLAQNDLDPARYEALRQEYRALVTEDKRKTAVLAQLEEQQQRHLQTRRALQQITDQCREAKARLLEQERELQQVEAARRQLSEDRDELTRQLSECRRRQQSERDEVARLRGELNDCRKELTRALGLAKQGRSE